VNTFVVFIVGVPVRQPGECRTSSSRQCRGQVLCVPTVPTWIWEQSKPWPYTSQVRDIHTL